MNARAPIWLEIREFSKEFASVAFSGEKRNSPAAMWGRLKDGIVSRLTVRALAYSKEGSHLASARMYANAARMEANHIEKGKFFALAAQEATLACNLKGTLKYDQLAIGAYREVKQFGLAREHGIESGKRYRLSASDSNTKWTAAERKTLHDIAKNREPNNEGRVIIDSYVNQPGEEDYYYRLGSG